MSTTRGAETPIALDPDGVPIVVDGVLAEDSAAADASESCLICMSRPRAVRFLPCGHASLCQLCTIQEMQRSGQCPVARCSVVQLVAVPVDPSRERVRLTVGTTGSAASCSSRQLMLTAEALPSQAEAPTARRVAQIGA